MPNFSAPIPAPTRELEPIYNEVVRKFGVTAGRVVLKLVEVERCSIWDLRECARAKGDEVLKALRQIIFDDDVREQLRPFVRTP